MSGYTGLGQGLMDLQHSHHQVAAAVAAWWRGLGRAATPQPVGFTGASFEQQEPGLAHEAGRTVPGRVG